MPFAKVTTRAPGSSRVSAMKPGASRVCSAPMFRMAAHASALVWTAEGGATTHYNVSLEVAGRPGGGAVVLWTADFRPDDVKPRLATLIEAATRAIKRSLDAPAQYRPMLGAVVDRAAALRRTSGRDSRLSTVIERRYNPPAPS